MKTTDLQVLLAQMPDCRIGVIGDFCVDAYWMLDQGERAISVETGKLTYAVTGQRYTLGGAANIVANLAALSIGALHAFAVIGDDIFGREMISLLAELGVNCAGVVQQDQDWDTAVYAKQYLGTEELERFDFGCFNTITPATTEQIIARLAAALPNLDVLILNRQITNGLCSGPVYDRLLELAAAHPQCRFLLDFRDIPEDITGLLVKLNAVEAATFCGEAHDIFATIALDDVQRYAQQIYARSGQPVIITRGEWGMLVYNGQIYDTAPGVQIMKEIDIVGAGDTAVSALAASIAAGANLGEAAQVANLAAAVTVQKLRQTGTASSLEISAANDAAAYIHNPELAGDIRRARYLADSQIEIVNPDLHLGAIKHAVFDHDGTLSVLRENWEAIMEALMLRVILGPRYATASAEEWARVQDYSRHYIDQSTGIQTILQMQALVEIVREFGYVPEEDILDAPAYKELYNNDLMTVIDQRRGRLERGELTVADYTLKGTVALLDALHERGITLYLASGTDEVDVQAEAVLMGYAGLFGGRIYGAVGDVSKYSKKMVIERIMRENRLQGQQLITFGDGPVEIRETKKQGGIAVGVASDEVRRYGLNEQKRARLIRAGADIILPDYSQLPLLLRLLDGETHQ